MPHQCTDCGRTFADGSKEMLSGCPDCGGNKFQFLPAGAVDSGPETGASADAPKAPGSPAGRSAGGTAPKKAPEDSARSPRSGSKSSAATGSEATAADASAGPETEGDDPSAVDRAAATVRDWVRSGGSDDGDGDESRSADRVGSTRTDAPENRNAAAEAQNARAETRTPAPEDSAQANARSDVVSESELPDAAPTDSPTSAPPSDSPASAAEPPRGGEVADTPNEESPGLKELREELNSQFESIRIVEPGQYELNLMELYEREEYIIALKEDGKYVIEVPDRWESSDR